MNDLNRQVTSPLQWQRSRRNHDVTVLTSFPAGRMAPLAVIPMLREDQASGRLSVAVEMQETREIIVNPVRVRVMAYLVPWLAFERFNGSRDEFDRSYMQQNGLGGAPIPFFETQAFGTHGANAVYKALGYHAKSTDLVNTMPLEAYNLIWNFRAKNRSKSLTARTRLDATLAPAFWRQGRFANIVADFDDATMDGEVPLTIVSGNLPVKSNTGFISVKSALDGTVRNLRGKAGTNDITSNGAVFAAGTHNLEFDNVYAELQSSGVKVSLANLDMARKVQAFAKLREQFAGHDDDYIIDMLMEGLHIPDQAFKQPMLLADQTMTFGQAKRYATDSGNLDESAVNGAAMGNLSIRVPRLHTGGVIMVVAEALPDLMHERQRDPFLYLSNTSSLPEADRDHMDPQKVAIVTNGMIDTDHATPAATFGYDRLNWQWDAFGPRVGGKFLRPLGGAGFVEVRQRLWASEAANPTLGASWFIAQNVNVFPFLDQASDPFEVTVLGSVGITGNTQFGPPLIEASNNYDEVMEDVPMERIVK